MSISSRDQSQLDNNDTQKEWPLDLYLHIAEACDEPAQISALRCASQLTKDAVSSSNQFRFYKSNYSYHPMTPQIGYYILNLNKLDATHFRLGNKMVMQGIAVYLKGCFEEAQSLFIDAMCKHGSSRAMLMLDMLSRLPGRIMFTSLSHLHYLYDKRENQIILNLVLKQHKDAPAIQGFFYTRLLNDAYNRLESNLKSLYDGIKFVYIQDNGLSLTNLDKLVTYYEKTSSAYSQNSSNNQEHGIDLTFIVDFDVQGLVGLTEPSKNAWYLSVEADPSNKPSPKL